MKNANAMLAVTHAEIGNGVQITFYTFLNHT